jgi:hypothetical protein
MALRKKFPERPNNGSSYRMSVGFELRDGQRKQAQFTLGTNRRVAQQKYNALNDWWENVVALPPNGIKSEKVWTAELVAQAFASVAPIDDVPL